MSKWLWKNTRDALAHYEEACAADDISLFDWMDSSITKIALAITCDMGSENAHKVAKVILALDNFNPEYMYHKDDEE